AHRGGVMKRVLGIAMLVACCAAAQDDVSIRVTLEPPVSPFHKHATYMITVEAPSTAVVRFDSMVEKFGGLQVTSGPEHRTVPLDNDRVRISESYRIEGIFPDEYFIESATVTV